MKLDWKKYYADTMTAKLDANFSLDKIREITQNISDKLLLRGKKGFVGVAVHFKDRNKWTPSLSTSFGDKVKLFVGDSGFESGKEELYENDEVDKIQIFVHVDEKKQFLRPKQLDDLIDIPNLFQNKN